MNESVKKEKFVMKNLFFDNVSQSSMKLWTIIPADVKANVKQGKKEMMAVSYKFLQEVSSKLETQCKKGMCFSFNFGLHSIAFIWKKVS